MPLTPKPSKTKSPKSESQKQAVVAYFAHGCKPQGKLTLGLEVEHFITHAGGEPVTFAEIQSVMQQMQGPRDESILIDGLYMGYQTAWYGISLEPACQLEISIVPQRSVADMMEIYRMFSLQLNMTLAPRGLHARHVSCHPTRRAEDLPLIPKLRYEAMDRYFKNTGASGIRMMRATASTQLSIDYFSEADFVQKMRAACLLTPLFALLSDNAPCYAGNRNHAYSMRTSIWQDVDPDRCGVPPHLMDEDFGFASYAESVLNCPQIVALRGSRIRAVGSKTAADLYGAVLKDREIEQILSMVFYDVRLKSYLEIRGADCMPPRYIAAYAQLIKSVFDSPAALRNVLQHYAGATTGDIANAKMAVTQDGYNAWVYGRPIAGELTWLLMQARSRTQSPEERALLAPFTALVAARKTIREEPSEDYE